MKTERQLGWIHAAALAGMFMGVICLPLVSMWLGWGQGPEVGEKRELAERPGLPHSLAEWTAYPREYEAYFNDHFGWRNWLIMMRGLLVLQGVASHPDVFYDLHSRMLFYRPDRASDGQHSTARDLAKRSRILKYLLRTAAWAEAKGMTYQFVAIPSRISIYPEAHPMGRYLQGQRLLDEIGQRVQRADGKEYLDITGLLAAHRNDPEGIYYKYDTHWTDHGARLGYEAILGRLRRQGLALEPYPESAYDYVERPMSGDITGLLGINSMSRWLETCRSPVLKDSHLRTLEIMGPEGKVLRTETGTPQELLEACRELRQFRLKGTATGPRALVIRDSYTIALVPYLAEHFSETTFIRTRPGEYKLPEWVERTNPDVVLEIFGEPNIMRF